MLNITGLYLGLNGLVFVVLAINVIRLRWKFQVSLGDGGRDELNKGIRAFGNNAEYLAVIMLLFAILEFKGYSPALLHTSGILFTLGRISHALAILGKAGKFYLFFRAFGVLVTLGIVVLFSLCLIASGIKL